MVTPIKPPAVPVIAKPSNPLSLPQVSVAVGGGEGDWGGALRIMALLTLLTVAPAILLTMTSFTRIIIVFGFLRQTLVRRRRRMSDQTFGVTQIVGNADDLQGVFKSKRGALAAVHLEGDER